MTTTDLDRGGEWDSNFTVVPPGYYKAVVKSAEAKVSKNQNKMVTLVLCVEDDEYNGVTIYNHLMFMPDADNFNNTKRSWFQQSAGIQYSLEDDNATIAKLIVNKKVTIKVKTAKDNQGVDRNEIAGVHSYSWMPKNPNEKLSLGNDDDGNDDGLDNSFL